MAILRILPPVTAARLLALATPASFALLAAVLAACGAVSPAEAAWTALSVALAYAPSGFLAPGGWRRRGAELALLPAAFALVTVGEAPLRHALVPPLVLVAALAAAWAVPPGTAPRRSAMVAGSLALAIRAAGGLGCTGESAAAVLVAAAVAVAVAVAASRLPHPAGLAMAMVAGALPLQRDPLAALLGGGTLLALFALVGPAPWIGRLARAWLPAAFAAAFLGVSLAPWGGIAPGRALPDAGMLAVAVGLLAATVTPWLPPALAGPLWLAATLAWGPPTPPPPDRAAVTLTAAAPTATLPAGTGGTYIGDLALTNAAGLPGGTHAATAQIGGADLAIRVGTHTVEWAHERADVRPRAAHPLPSRVTYRGEGRGREAFWAVAGRLVGEVPSGIAPTLRRADTLPPEVTLVVATAGPSRPTPPRRWGLPQWLLAASVAVAALQGLFGTWRRAGAWVPWGILTAASVVARMAVEPHRLLAERHAVDLALAALLFAWWPAARTLLERRRVLAAGAALFLPLALATPKLAVPMGDEPYHLLLLDSLARDFDLDVANNADLERHPENRPYVPPPGRFLQPPTLAVVLLPAFAVGGRGGALLLLALAGAGTVALLARHACALGLPASRAGILAMALLASYPLATFATQIWPDVLGALAAAVASGWLARGVRGPVAATAAAVLPVWLKTRFALALLPIAVAAWWPHRLRRATLVRVGLAAGAAAGLALSFSWLAFGNPLDPLGRRHLADLVPASAGQAITTLGGLAFDAASGLAFSAPLLLVALAGVVRLWKRGGKGERALLLGAALTVAALLGNLEWRGGDSPPARYLVVLLPALALAGAMVLAQPLAFRRLALLVLPPTLVVSWVAVTRPHLLVNTGVGGTWLADALAVRFEAAAWELFPSFLRASSLRWWVPLAAVTGAAAAAWLAARRPQFARIAVAVAAALWLVAAAAVAATLAWRPDARIELESPHVTRHGGILWPPAGQMSRFRFANGWVIGVGEAVEVPVRVAAGARYVVEGYLLEEAVGGCALAVRWDEGPVTTIPVAGASPGALALPPPPGPGRHTLHLAYQGPVGGFAMLDAVVRRR